MKKRAVPQKLLPWAIAQTAVVACVLAFQQIIMAGTGLAALAIFVVAARRLRYGA